MHAACAVFEGFHDFRSFTRDDPDEKSTTVELQKCRMIEVGPMLVINIQGSHFLWKMVRQMVGIIAEVGRGAMKPDQVRELLRSSSTLPAVKTAPPSGLFLHHVRYSDNEPEAAVTPTILISIAVDCELGHDLLPHSASRWITRIISEDCDDLLNVHQEGDTYEQDRKVR
jgi:tRNA pseudouridine38-40 synthase